MMGVRIVPSSVHHRGSSPDRGSISIEAVLVIPAFLLFLVLIIGIGRVAMVHQDIHAAAVQGARVASLQDTAASAVSTGRNAVHTTLATQETPCVSADIIVDASALEQPPGYTGAVRVSVTCVVRLDDLMLPGVPGQMTITETFSAQIDAYVDR